MSQAYEYGEEDPEDEILDEEDEIRMAILEAEANEVWQEEPGDEDEDPQMPLNPLFGLFSAGGLNFPGKKPDDPEKKD